MATDYAVSTDTAVHPLSARRTFPRIAAGQLAWRHAALGAVLLVAAALNLWSLDREGYANTYYAAAVKSMLTSWHNFFYLSFDSGGFVNVDKAPLGLWVQAASAKVDALSGPHRGCTALPVPVVALSRICHRPITGRSSGLRTLPLYYGQGATRADGMGREGRTGAGLWYPGDGHIRPHREWMTDIGSALGRTDVAGDASSHALASRPLQQDDEERELGRMTQASWCFVLGR
jgi:hypothetical protein